MSSSERRRPSTSSPAAATPRPGVVVRSDGTGVWCALDNGDASRPYGPCRNATETAQVVSGSGHLHLSQRLPVGRRVLLLLTADGPWVVAHDSSAQQEASG